VRPGSDAQRARIQAGDRIIRIDGQPVAAAIAERLGPAVDAAQPAARAWALHTLAAGRRGVARTFELRGADGGKRTVTLPATRRFDRPQTPVSWSRVADDIGVIRINNSLGEQATVAAFDAALAQLRDTKGLLLDLRDCPSGGNSGVALGILGRFVDGRRPYQRHRIPRYGQADIERNWMEEVAPRGPFTYRAPVIVLVGHWTGSMGEGMAVGFDGMRRATVVGSAMAQLAGATETFTLARTGARVALPTEELFHVDGTPRHRWVPPVVIAPGASLSGTDAVMEHSRALLRDAPAIR
jgi:carboxyl-terminal processing protease